VIALLVLGGVIALGVGIYLGLPGEYQVNRDELEDALSKTQSKHKRVKRRFTPLDYLFRKKSESSLRNKERGRFKTVRGRRR